MQFHWFTADVSTVYELELPAAAQRIETRNESSFQVKLVDFIRSKSDGPYLIRREICWKISQRSKAVIKIHLNKCPNRTESKMNGIHYRVNLWSEIG